MCGDSFFCFASRRRHTRCYRDWSSDVCSSDLREIDPSLALRASETNHGISRRYRSEERRVGKSVDLGGRRIIKKKKTKEQRHGKRRWERRRHKGRRELISCCP